MENDFEVINRTCFRRLSVEFTLSETTYEK